MSYLDTAKLLRRLSDRDLAILDDIERFRLLSTRLIQRLHAPVGSAEHLSQGGATRATQRALQRLMGLGVIDHLERRVGGVRHGSQGFIWQLTSTGAGIQRRRHAHPRRRRYVEPNSLFTDHTLAVAETAIVIRELARSNLLDVAALQTEPDCWREYVDPSTTVITLKPDLYSVTATRRWEDHLFIEVDLSTEHLPRVLAKCHTYAAYHATGIEQQRTGVFPAVLWVTPDDQRATALRRAIGVDKTLPTELFTVINREQFADHLTEPGSAEEHPPPR